MNANSSGSKASSAATPNNSPLGFMSGLWPRRTQTQYPPGVTHPVVRPHPQAGSAPQLHRRLSGIRPSPSVEPPRVSDYTLGASPSPAYFAPADPQPPARAESDLQTISEAAGRPLADTASKRKQPAPQSRVSRSKSHAQTAAEQPNSGLPSSTHGSGSSGFRLFPRKPVMNPEGFKLGRVSGSGPRPPQEFVLHAELVRQGGVYIPMDSNPVAEASYQVDVTPPVPKQAPPQPIIMDPTIFASSSAPLRAQITSAVRSTGQDPPLGTIRSLAPPVSTLPMTSPLVERMPPPPEHEAGGLVPQSATPRPSEKQPSTATTTPTVQDAESSIFYDISKPTCSLNLVCYRSGAKGCDLQQVQCVLRTMFPSDESFDTVIEANPHLVYTDDQFFQEMHRLYTTRMCGFFRRYFSLKTLRAFRVLAYTPTTRPAVVPFDDFVLQEMMYAYRNPDRLSSTHDWIHWVFRLRRKDRRHALEFVEGWNTTRIAIFGSVPWLGSSLVGIIWAATGGDPQTAFTVASFILTSSSIILALLAIISSIESSGGLSR